MARLTDHQEYIKKNMEFAMDSAIAYGAPEVPELGNATQEALVEELGRINVARKAMEKVEKIVKSRLKAMAGADEFQITSDNFKAVQEITTRNALNQSKAKATLAEQGLLEEHMSVSEVPRLVVKER